MCRNILSFVSSSVEARSRIKVAAAVIVQGDKYLVTQRGYGAYKGFWEFPGGKIEAGESAEDAVVREIREELCVAIEVEKRLGTVEYEYPEFHLSMECFVCRIVSDEITLREHDGAQWLHADELNSVSFLNADVEVVKLIQGAGR